MALTPRVTDGHGTSCVPSRNHRHQGRNPALDKVWMIPTIVPAAAGKRYSSSSSQEEDREAGDGENTDIPPWMKLTYLNIEG